MVDWLKELRKRAPGDGAVRLMLLGGTALLFLIVLIDAFGARDRAVAARAAAGDDTSTETSTATVPSIYRVPRDLASEAAASMQARAEPTEPAPEMAEAETTDEVAEPEVTEEAPQEMPAEEATETEVAEETTEEAAPDMAAEQATGDAAEPELAQAETTEEAPQDMASEDATEEATAPEVAEAAPQDAPTEAATDDDALALLASADISNGEGVWRQCRACHVHDAEQNRGGPHLVNIIGREVGVAEGWRYSNALADHDGVWSVDALLAWLENPDAYIPGNQMAFRGLRNEQDRIDLLGFLNASSSN